MLFFNTCSTECASASNTLPVFTLLLKGVVSPRKGLEERRESFTLSCSLKSILNTLLVEHVTLPGQEQGTSAETLGLLAAVQGIDKSWQVVFQQVHASD